MEAFGGYLVEVPEYGFPIQSVLQFLQIKTGHFFLQFFLKCFPTAFRGSFRDTFFILLGNGQFLFFIAPIFRQVITHGLGFFFPLIFKNGSKSRAPVLIVGVACAGKGIPLTGSQAIATGGNTGFLVFTFPFSLLTGYFFFSSVIVVFDLCQFLFSAVFHPVYVFLGVFRLQRGKFPRQPALCSHTLLGFRFRFFIGLFRIGVSADAGLLLKLYTFFCEVFSSLNITIVFFSQPLQFLLFFPTAVIILFVESVGRKETVYLSAIAPPGIKLTFILRLRFCNLFVDFRCFFYQILNFHLKE